MAIESLFKSKMIQQPNHKTSELTISPLFAVAVNVLNMPVLANMQKEETIQDINIKSDFALKPVLFGSYCVFRKLSGEWIYHYLV